LIEQELRSELERLALDDEPVDAERLTTEVKYRHATLDDATRRGPTP
jgi:hypothetical protein